MRHTSCLLTSMVAAAGFGVLAGAHAADWVEADFPPPNAGRLVYTVMAGGNPACASYDGQNCLWGKSKGEIDYAKLKPLVCGAVHRRLYGSTGFEDPRHWCNLALKAGSTGAAAAPTAPQGVRQSAWSPWKRAADLDYRYRIEWDPATGGPGKTVIAVFELHNRATKMWNGSARSANCANNTLWDQTNATVPAGQTRQVRVRGPNCGTASNPHILPGVSIAHTL